MVMKELVPATAPLMYRVALLLESVTAMWVHVLAAMAMLLLISCVPELVVMANCGRPDVPTVCATRYMQLLVPVPKSKMRAPSLKEETFTQLARVKLPTPLTM